MYEEYLCRLLAPLGVYDLSENSLNRAELHALGGALDEISGRLDYAEREALLATAEETGLLRWEALFARRPAAVTVEERRAAVMALLRIDGDSLAPLTINDTLRGCGIRAKALEIDTGHLRVIFPETAGVPAEFEQIKKIILDILPCHLAVEFYFRYLTWRECEAAGYTWKSFQLAVPPEV